jgi:hypothetical protein
VTGPPIYRWNPFKFAIPHLHNIVSRTRILAPVFAALCGDMLDFRSVSCFLRSICFDRWHVASITLLSGIIYFLRECRAAIRTMSGRSQQLRPDRFQDLRLRWCS